MTGIKFCDPSGCFNNQLLSIWKTDDLVTHSFSPDPGWPALSVPDPWRCAFPLYSLQCANGVRFPVASGPPRAAAGKLRALAAIADRRLRLPAPDAHLLPLFQPGRRHAVLVVLVRPSTSQYPLLPGFCVWRDGFVRLAPSSWRSLNKNALGMSIRVECSASKVLTKVSCSKSSTSSLHSKKRRRKLRSEPALLLKSGDNRRLFPSQYKFHAPSLHGFAPETSVLSLIKCRVEAFQTQTCVFGGELPVDLGSDAIAGGLPGGDLSA